MNQMLACTVDLRSHVTQACWNVKGADEDVETMASYIMKRLGRTAHVGDTIDTPYGTMRVENMARVRITQVAIVRIPPTATEEYAD